MKKVNSPWRIIDPATIDFRRRSVFVSKYLSHRTMKRLYGLGSATVWRAAHGANKPTARTAQIMEAAYNDVMRLVANARRIKAGVGSVRKASIEKLPW
jgi:hypothetical protein